MGGLDGVDSLAPERRSFSTLHDLGDGQTLHGLLITLDTDERCCAASHLDFVPPNSLGYPFGALPAAVFAGAPTNPGNRLVSVGEITGLGETL